MRVKETYTLLFSYYLKPQRCIFTVYFDLKNLALSSAATELQIETIEIQHGQQGDINPYYKYLAQNISTHKLLPQYLWTWGERTQNKFNSITRAPYCG